MGWALLVHLSLNHFCLCKKLLTYCGGFNGTVSSWLRHLSAWSRDGGTIWGKVWKCGFVGRSISSREGLEGSWSHPKSSFLSPLAFIVEDVFGQCPALAVCSHASAMIMDSPAGTISQNKLILKLLLVIGFCHSSRKLVNIPLLEELTQRTWTNQSVTSRL